MRFYMKKLRTDIHAVRFALTALFSFKNEIFSRSGRAFYKNGQIFTPVKLFLELSCFLELIIAERFALLK
jgi:hypothetical protein